MALATETININVTIPDDSEYASIDMHFILSTPDADVTGGIVIPPQHTVVSLNSSGEGVANLWPNNRGYKGSHYVVKQYSVVAGATTVEVITHGKIQPTYGVGPFTLAALLQAGGSVVDEVFTQAITQDQYQAVLDAATSADASATNAETAANQAEAARDAAIAGVAGVYADTTAGLSGTSNGDYFIVPVGDGTDAYTIYKNDGGTAVDVTSVPDTDYVRDTNERLLPGVVFESTTDPDYPLIIRDEAGNIVMRFSRESATDMAAMSVGDFKIEVAPDDDWAWHIGDHYGGIHIGYHRTLGLQMATALDMAESQEIMVAFVEPDNDACRTALVSWVSTGDNTLVEYRISGSSVWQSANAYRSRAFPGLSAYKIHTVQIDGLSAGTIYDLRWPGSTFTEKFKTPPKSDVKVVIASDHQTVGDLGGGSYFEDFGTYITSQTPDLLLLNGDYVNDDGLTTSTTGQYWLDFLTGLATYYRTSDDALMPMIAVMGNHEGRNSAGTSNALAGGDGTPGPIEQIMSWGYDPEHETRGFRSAATLSVGKELFVISLETDHTVPLTSQVSWLSSQLAANAENHRSVIVLAHAPAFYGMDDLELDDVATQARVMRNEVWPALEPYASKIRAVFVGHEHILSITPRLKMYYDAGDTDAQNDINYRVDNTDGVRQLGAGPWRGARLDLNAADMAEVGLDGNSKFVAAMGYDSGTDSATTHGTGLTNVNKEIWNVWIAEFSASAFTATAVDRSGNTFYTLTDSL